MYPTGRLALVPLATSAIPVDLWTGPCVAIFSSFLLLAGDDGAVVLASAGAAVFLGYAGVSGSDLRSSVEVSEAQSRSCRFLLLRAVCCTQTT